MLWFPLRMPNCDHRFENLSIHMNTAVGWTDACYSSFVAAGFSYIGLSSKRKIQPMSEICWTNSKCTEITKKGLPRVASQATMKWRKAAHEIFWKDRSKISAPALSVVSSCCSCGSSWLECMVYLCICMVYMYMYGMVLYGISNIFWEEDIIRRVDSPVERITRANRNKW